MPDASKLLAVAACLGGLHSSERLQGGVFSAPLIGGSSI